jgi:ubiquinone/menaquinone biosynthesis C-methylase UbiE
MRTDGPLLHGDAAALPFADASFDTALSLWISTDVDDFGAVLLEAARVLRPGGVFVAYGVHPCFNGPHVVYEEDGRRIVHPTYRQSGWHTELPWWAEDGIRRRIGMNHVTLAEYLNAIIRSGLVPERFDEPAGYDIPHALAVRARKA